MSGQHEILKLDGVVNEFIRALPALAQQQPWLVSSNIAGFLASDLQEDLLAERGAKIDKDQRRRIVMAGAEQIPHMLPRDQYFVNFLIDACAAPRHLGPDAHLKSDLIARSSDFIVQIPKIRSARVSLTNNPEAFVGHLYVAAEQNFSLRQKIKQLVQSLGSRIVLQQSGATRPHSPRAALDALIS